MFRAFGVLRVLRVLRVFMRQWGEAGSEALASSQVASTTSPRGFPDSPGEGADLLPGPGGPPGTQGGVSTRKST